MKKSFIFIGFLIFLSVFTAKGEIKIVFRYDDYLLNSSKLNDSILYIFHKNNIPLCIGIIPFDNANLFNYSLNEDQINNLRSRIQRNEIEVALHGYNHSNNVKGSFLTKNYSSEFASVSFASQLEKLTKGKRFLDSLLQIKTKIFIPPFNTYDNNTLRVLGKLDLDIISANMVGPFINTKIQYIPGTFVSFMDLPKILEKNRDQDVIIVLYFHPFSFIGGSPKYVNDYSKQISFIQLDTLLQWLKGQDISFYTFSDLSKTANFDKALYLVNTSKYNLVKKILYNFKHYNYGTYPTSESQKQKMGFLFSNFILHILSFLFVYFFVITISKILHPNLNIVIFLLVIFSLLGFIYFYYHRMDFSFWIIFIMFMVNYIALILGILRVYKPWKYSLKEKMSLPDQLK